MIGTRVLRAFALITLVSIGALVPQVARAQSIRGSVVLPDSATPVAGVIVLAVDARGTTAARTLTNRRGEFTLGVHAAGVYTVKVLRIGYRPTVAPSVSVSAAEPTTLRLVFAAEAVVLTGMSVRDQETCRVNADTGLAVARVWEEARKAMLTSQLSAEGAPLVAEWVEYDRMLDSTGRLVRQQQVRSSKYPTTHAFRSAPAAVLASEGYVTADNTGTTFYAPDAEVLLSDAFVVGHCFRLVAAPRGSDNLIGVAFQPSRDRREKREIEGTLWLDRSSAELRTLEFRYTNLPEVVSVADPGGRVEFVRLSDGNWLVSRWNLRMPKVAARERSTEGGQRKVLMAASNLVVRNVQVTGGEVSRVTRHDSLMFVAAGPSVAVQLVAQDTLLPKGGATLTLEGTDYRATAGANGAFRLTPVLAGRYRARVSTPLMDSLNVPPVVKDIDTHDDARVDTLALPTGWDVVSRTCPRDSVTRGEGMLHGRVLDERARPLGQAAVTVSWKGNFTIVSSAHSDNVGYNEKTLGAMSDDAGQWRVCGVPTETPITVRVLTDSLSDVRTTRVADNQPFGAVDLVARRIAQSTRDLEIAKAQIALPRALVEFVVTDPNGNLLPEATLEVVSSAGASRTVVTGPSGRALVPDVAPGRLTLRARRIGFKPGQVVATVAIGRNTVPVILSEVATPTLDTVRVIGGLRVTSRLDEFETRRVNHATAASITREDILKRNPTETWQVLASIPSMRISDRDNMVVAVSTRTLMSSFGGRPCYMRVMVDGLEMTKEGHEGTYDLRILPKPEEIHGIEVFAGPATIPLQYGGIGDPTKWCGLIAVWTR